MNRYRVTLVWSMWSGYRERDGGAMRKWAARTGVEPHFVLSGGHAWPDDLRRLTSAISAKETVWVHKEDGHRNPCLVSLFVSGVRFSLNLGRSRNGQRNMDYQTRGLPGVSRGETNLKSPIVKHPSKKSSKLGRRPEGNISHRLIADFWIEQNNHSGSNCLFDQSRCGGAVLLIDSEALAHRSVCEILPVHVS